MARVLTDFTVLGTAKPAGSKRAFANKYTGKIVVTDDSGSAGKTWRQDVAGAARDAMGDTDPFDGGVILELTFFRARPKGHYGSGRNARVVKHSAPAHPVTKPDLTKVLRAVEDALTGIVWRDDAQVIEHAVSKAYGTPERVEVCVLEHPEQKASDLSVAAMVDEGPVQPSLLAA